MQSTDTLTTIFNHLHRWRRFERGLMLVRELLDWGRLATLSSHPRREILYWRTGSLSRTCEIVITNSMRFLKRCLQFWVCVPTLLFPCPAFLIIWAISVTESIRVYDQLNGTLQHRLLHDWIIDIVYTYRERKPMLAFAATIWSSGYPLPSVREQWEQTDTYCSA